MTGLVRAHRLSWGFGDQALVSLVSAAVSLQGAAQLPVRDFGLLATATAGYYLVLSAIRGTVSEVYVARLVHRGGRLTSAAAGQAQGAALQLSAVPAAGFVGLGLVLPDGGTVFVALGVALPILLLQDVRRAILVGSGETRRAAASSATAFAAQLAVGAALQLTGRVTAPALVLGWAVAVGLGALVIPVGRIRIRRAARTWLADGRAYWPRFLTETAVQGAAGQLPLLLIASIASTTVVAGLRAATLLLSPVVMLHQAVGQLVVAEAGRVRRDDLAGFCGRVQVLLLGAAAGWFAVVSVIPTRMLSAAVGDNLDLARQALPGMTVAAAALMASLAPSATLRVLGRFGTAVRIRLLTAPLAFTFPVLLAIAGAPISGIAWGSGAAAVVTLVVWDWCRRDALSAGRHRPSRFAEPVVPVGRAA